MRTFSPPLPPPPPQHRGNTVSDLKQATAQWRILPKPGGFGLWAYLPDSEEGLKGPRIAALGKLGSGAPHSPNGHAAGGRGTRLLL